MVVFSCVFHLWWPIQRKITVRLSRFKTSLNPHIPNHVSYWLRSDTKCVINFRYFSASLQSTTILWVLHALEFQFSLHKLLHMIQKNCIDACFVRCLAALVIEPSMVWPITVPVAHIPLYLCLFCRKSAESIRSSTPSTTYPSVRPSIIINYSVVLFSSEVPLCIVLRLRRQLQAPRRNAPLPHTSLPPHGL